MEFALEKCHWGQVFLREFCLPSANYSSALTLYTSVPRGCCNLPICGQIAKGLSAIQLPYKRWIVDGALCVWERKMSCTFC